MKKLLLTCGIFLAGVFFVNAQDKTDAKATKLVDKLTEVCSLSPDQVTKLKPLAVSFIKTREANKQQYASDPAGLKSANKTNNQNYKAQLQAILTPDQMQKFKDYNAQRRAKMKSSKTATGGGDDDK